MISDLPLSQVAGWTTDLVDKLSTVWITTARQVVALGATSDGLTALSQQLEVDVDTAQQLLDAARAHLSPAERSAAEKSVDTTDLGLGVLPPMTDDEGNS